MFRSVRSVFLFVTDIRQSAEWYGKLLGYPPRFEEERFVLFDVGPTQLCFHLADTKSPVVTGGCVAYWWVDDFAGAVARAEALGGRLYRGPILAEPEVRICQILDPFGNVFGLEGRAS